MSKSRKFLIPVAIMALLVAGVAVARKLFGKKAAEEQA